MSDEMDPMAEIRASFFIECEELMEALQEGLQAMSDENGDDETINVVFRAVHSIKGGAGAFGLEELVRFAHRYETALDEVRAGRLNPNEQALSLFFSAADHLSDLIRICRDDEETTPDRSNELLAELDGLIGTETEEANEAEDIDFQPMGVSLDLDSLISGDADPGLQITEPKLEASITHEITFAPHFDFFETGNDPVHLIRALQELGACKCEVTFSNLPRLQDLDAERPYMEFRVLLDTQADNHEIHSVFEFVEGLCSLKISSPDATEHEEHNAQDKTATKGDLQNSNKQTGKAEAAIPTEPKTSATSELDTVVKVNSSNDAQQERRTPSRANNSATKAVVRVDLDRIERLVNLVGELVINQAMLAQSLEKSGLSSHSDTMNGLEEFQRLTRDIQDSVMMIRAQPVKSLFQRMSRIVREASSAVKKDVRLITEGENTEVDKTVIERLADPLTHMIRNAVDHGLETPQERLSSGKDKQGVVRLKAFHKSGRIMIEVSDDGNGINREKVLSIAINKGIVPSDVSLTEGEIDNLLFQPGFSTAETVSDLSGRGVGMDVVKTAIQALGGRISITSVPGAGTTFSISLPLTLAVLDGMIVQVAGETLVIPLNLVSETLTLNEAQISEISSGNRAICVRGQFIPVYDLGSELGYRPEHSNPAGCAVLIIAEEDGPQHALLTDEIHDQRQVVIKGLSDGIYRAPGVAAATILGDGKIALILDPTDLTANSARNARFMAG